jgi:hypothetical protein
MEATFSSERLVDFQWTTWRYIPEDTALHNLHCENLTSYRIVLLIATTISEELVASKSG